MRERGKREERERDVRHASYENKEGKLRREMIGTDSRPDDHGGKKQTSGRK